MDTVKYLLTEKQLPTAWYDIRADLSVPLPPLLHPGTLLPITKTEMEPLFSQALLEQEFSVARWWEIPQPIRQIYRQWRPTPLYRARRLEKELDTPAKIYYKYEGVSPTGSHKPNTAIAQAYYNAVEGVKRLTTETGAGQWGSALALAGTFFNLEVLVFMVKVSYQQKPYRRALMEAYNAKVLSSPSQETEAGRKIGQRDPETTGSLGIAISEAVEVAAKDDATKYSLGSVLNHVLLHQTVIGLEALVQMEMAGDYPEVIIGCTGGGSNFAGMAFPFMKEKLLGRKDTQFIAVEPSACPTLTAGKYSYDYGDTAQKTPLRKMHTLGNGFVPAGIHAGGLRYHGMAPLVSHLVNLGTIEPRAYEQLDCFAAGITWARAEGILPAPEANHAVKGAIDEALRCKEEGISRTILFNLCGHGHFDLQAYIDYQAGNLCNSRYPQEEIAMALAGLPEIS